MLSVPWRARLYAQVLVPTGLGGLSGNKGGIAFCLSLSCFSVVFVNCHLPSGASAKDKDERNASFREVLRQLGADLAAAKLPSVADSATFCFGDLNYRLTLPNKEVRWRMSCRDWRTLLYSDQLMPQLCGEAGSPFECWDEGEIAFRPTCELRAEALIAADCC